jgi:hypothetical protein
VPVVLRPARVRALLLKVWVPRQKARALIPKVRVLGLGQRREAAQARSGFGPAAA